MDNLVNKFKQLKKDIASLSEKKARIAGKKEQKLLELKEKYNKYREGRREVRRAFGNRRDYGKESIKTC